MEAPESSRQEIAEKLREKYNERNAPGMFDVQDVGRAYTPIMKLFGRAAIPETTAKGVKALIDRKMKSGEISSPWEIFENMMGDTYGKDGKAD